MRILFVASEAFPLIKTGGLADVAGALPAALVEAGEDVRLLLPAYPAALAALEDAAVIADLGDPLGAGPVHLIRGQSPGMRLEVWMVSCPNLFDRPGNPYLGPDGRDWPDNFLRFAVLSWVAATIAAGGWSGGWTPDIVHANDWQTGLVPAYLKTWGVARPPTVFTVHNLAYQGRFSPAILNAVGLPWESFAIDGVEFYGDLSYLKAGLYYADRITTVSPTYAHEIQTDGEGQGLQGLLLARDGDLSGILNGEDPKVWDPEHDPAIAHHFTASHLSGKAKDKTALQREFKLDPVADAPLFGVISRLAEQKGIDLILDAVHDIVGRGGQIVILGSGDSHLEQGCRDAAAAWPGRVATRIGFEEPLAHRMQAGCDLVLMPSRFEPCGLTQLYALRYGTIPVVRRTGGLADTVFDALDGAEATGFVFRESTLEDFQNAIHRALALYRQPSAWQELQRRAMGQDFSWRRAAENYRRLYRELV
ncbi:MAG: glycogen synthase GlgA [Alphaproteobacteria bacterium]